MNILYNKNINFNYAGLFTSEEEWIHPEATEITYEIIYVTSGTVYMYDEKNGNIEANKGQLMLLEPGSRHYGIKKCKNVSFYWVHFHADKESFPFETRFFESFDNPHLFKELLHFSFLPEKPEYLINSILIRILSEMCWLSCKTGTASDKTAEEIYEWLRINACSGLTAKKAANHFGFSADHITRIIRKSYGTGTKALIDTFILSRAKEQLANTGKYIKEIAYELGFESDKAFIGFFKYHEGIFPSEFRNKYYKIHMNKK